MMIKRLLRFVNDRLNIRLIRGSGLIYVTLLVSTVIGTYSNPVICKEIVSNLPPEYLAAESISVSISTLLIGMLWKGKTRDVVIRNFMMLAILETIASIILGYWLLFVSYNVWVMAIGSIIYVNLISIFINKCVMMFKSKLFIEKEREDFDNSSSTINSIAALLGFGLALLFMPSLKVGILCWSIACVFDDVGWMYIYFKNKKHIIENKERDK